MLLLVTHSQSQSLRSDRARNFEEILTVGSMDRGWKDLFGVWTLLESGEYNYYIIINTYQ